MIGDPVNEAARLADLAQTAVQRIMSSAAAIERADSAERRHWAPHGSVILRGRSEPTHICVPIGHNEVPSHK